MIKRVIITGATGTIGMALIRKCIEKDIEAVLLVNPASRRLDRIPDDPHVKMLKCGLDDLASADAKVIGSADVMFHLAWSGAFGDARNDKALQDRNFEHTIDAVRLAHRLGCSVFVGAGSQAEYGRVEGVLKPDTPCNPENEYGRAKLRASLATRELCHEMGMRHIWPRILSIYGPYDGDYTMIMSVIAQLLDGKKPALTAGEQIWDFLYTDDVAEAYMLLAEKGVDGSVYPIGSGIGRPLREYIEILRDQIDPSLPLGFGEVPYSDRQVMHLCADISKLREDTGFSPKVGFEEGIRRTIEYVRNNRT